MAGAYSIGGLEPGAINRAFAMVAALAPEITPTDWEDFARQAEGRQIAILEDSMGYHRGICIYAVADADKEPIVEALLFAALSAVDRRGIARAMLDFLRAEARRAGSRMIHFRTLSGEALADYLRGAPPQAADGVMLLVD